MILIIVNKRQKVNTFPIEFIGIYTKREIVDNILIYRPAPLQDSFCCGIIET
ncbi:hypothetical protein SELSPUOL_01244 [Selenomonas sputigena ATCC 35185]|uniref:Uncharacterized protein n=1 Tax=Selenomonas sputigena (strain ATCC 35185 / DSM 20758 / CCUG 44933 / VPI D19B-28) TaxID=546271 RepID=C9LUV4_SELS3|nr:hypothetical protein SELSPUOL_01244 [Selenomonas sputigena ATCC 35185]